MNKLNIDMILRSGLPIEGKNLISITSDCFLEVSDGFSYPQKPGGKSRLFWYRTRYFLYPNLTRTRPETDFCYPNSSHVDTSLEVTCRIIISFLPSREIALSMIFRKVSFTLRGISSGHNFSAQPYVAKILL